VDGDVSLEDGVVAEDVGKQTSAWTDRAVKLHVMRHKKVDGRNGFRSSMWIVSLWKDWMAISRKPGGPASCLWTLPCRIVGESEVIASADDGGPDVEVGIAAAGIELLKTILLGGSGLRVGDVAA
jgi:hypothetical protein